MEKKFKQIFLFNVSDRRHNRYYRTFQQLVSKNRLNMLQS